MALEPLFATLVTEKDIIFMVRATIFDQDFADIDDRHTDLCFVDLACCMYSAVIVKWNQPPHTQRLQLQLEHLVPSQRARHQLLLQPSLCSQQLPASYRQTLPALPAAPRRMWSRFSCHVLGVLRG